MTSALLMMVGLVTSAPANASSTSPSTYGATRVVQPAEDEVRSWALSPAGPGGISTRDEFAYQMDAGTSIDDAVTLYNLGNVQLTFRVYAADGYTTDDGHFSVRPGTEEPVDAGSWVTLDQELVTVPAGQQVTIPLTVDVPAGVTPGDHAAGIVATVYEEKVVDPTQPVDVEFRTGTRMYVRISGEATSAAGISSVDVEYHGTRNPFDGTADVTFRLRNDGTTRLSGSATVTVRGLLGIGRRTVTVPNLAEILPGGQISVTTRLEGVPASGVLTATVDVVPAAVDGVDSAADVSGSATATAIPWSLLLYVVILVLVALTARALRRHRLAFARDFQLQ